MFCRLVLILLVFNARAQRSWRRRSWHRPRTPSPSSSPSSSWRHLRLDTIRARITKFGPEVELDEICSHTKFDVTGYFRSPASGHLESHFSNFSVQYLRNSLIKKHQIWTFDCTQPLVHPLQIWSILLTPFACVTQNRFQIRRPISRKVLNALYPNFASWFLTPLAIVDQGSKWKYFIYRLHR